jgi:hypothetical protein
MINLLSSFAAQHEPDLYQYNAAIVPFLALGAVYAAARIRGSCVGGKWQVRTSALTTVVLLAGALTYHFWYGHTPLAAHFDPVRCGAHCDTRAEVKAQIPPDAAVSAQTTLVPHVSQRAQVFEYPQGLNVAAYVFLDVASPQYAFPLTDQFFDSIESLWTSSEFGLLEAKNGYLLFGRGQPSRFEALPPAFYDYALSVEPAPTHPLALDVGPLRLVGGTYRMGREGWVDVTLYWETTGQVPPSYRPSIALGLTDGALTAWHRQDLPFRWAEQGWKIDEIVHLKTGISLGHGPGAGWGTDWTIYAGVVDDATGSWVEPRESNGQPVADLLRAPIDAAEARLVPLVWLRNYWGFARSYRQR